MSKFNLKKYAKKDNSRPIDKKLQEQHEEAPNETGEAQLEEGRVSESNVLIEKMLEKQRTGGADEITERRLDKDKADFNIKNRNASAFEGNINKLEEQRLENNPVEKEKYEPASEVPKQFRWWENVKSPDGLKLAKKKVKIAKWGFEDIDEFSSPEEKAINDFDINEVEQEIKAMQVIKTKDIPSSRDVPPGIYMVLKYDPRDFGGTMEEIEEAALSEILLARPELSGLITTNDLDVGEDTVTLRVVGDEFRSIVIDHSKEDITEEIFDEVVYEEKTVGGTPMAIGQIKINIPIDERNKDTVARDIVDFVRSRHPNINIGEESLDVSNILDGEVGYMVSEGEKATNKFPITEVDTSTLEPSLAQSNVKKK